MTNHHCDQSFLDWFSYLTFFFLTFQQLNYWVPGPTWLWIGVNPIRECPWVSAVNNTEVLSRIKSHKVMTKNWLKSFWVDKSFSLGDRSLKNWSKIQMLPSDWLNSKLDQFFDEQSLKKGDILTQKFFRHPRFPLGWE